MENQEEIILEQKAIEILEKSKAILTSHRNKLLEISHRCQEELAEQEKQLRILGKKAIQELTPKSEKIQTLVREIEAISIEINDI